jgi:hypothetical protein
MALIVHGAINAFLESQRIQEDLGTIIVSSSILAIRLGTVLRFHWLLGIFSLIKYRSLGEVLALSGVLKAIGNVHISRLLFLYFIIILLFLTFFVLILFCLIFLNILV